MPVGRTPPRHLRALALCLLLGLITTIAIAWTCAILIHLPGAVNSVLPSPNTPTVHAREYFKYAGGPLPNPYIQPPIQPPIPPTTIVRPFTRLPIRLDDEPGPSVHAVRYSRFGSAYITTGVNTGSFPAAPGAVPIDQVIPRELRHHAIPWLTGDAAYPNTDATLYLGARGWPFLALWCEFETAAANPTGGGLPWVGKPKGGIALPWPHVTPSWYVPPPPLTTLPYRPLPLGLAADTIIFATLWWTLLFGLHQLRTTLRLRNNRCSNCNYDLRATPPDHPCPECGQARP